jgi:hypothetical protein
MSEFGGTEYPTVSIARSQILERADGSIALMLELREQGPIAFVVTLDTIPLLRQSLDHAEMLLKRSVGHA